MDKVLVFGTSDEGSSPSGGIEGFKVAGVTTLRLIKNL